MHERSLKVAPASTPVSMRTSFAMTALALLPGPQNLSLDNAKTASTDAINAAFQLYPQLPCRSAKFYQKIADLQD